LSRNEGTYLAAASCALMDILQSLVDVQIGYAVIQGDLVLRFQ